MTFQFLGKGLVVEVWWIGRKMMTTALRAETQGYKLELGGELSRTAEDLRVMIELGLMTALDKMQSSAIMAFWALMRVVRSKSTISGNDIQSLREDFERFSKIGEEKGTLHISLVKVGANFTVQIRLNREAALILERTVNFVALEGLEKANRLWWVAELALSRVHPQRIKRYEFDGVGSLQFQIHGEGADWLKFQESLSA